LSCLPFAPLETLVLTQRQYAAAAEPDLQNEAAQALTQAGLTTEQISTHAAADPGLCMLAVRYFAECCSRKRKPPTLGLLVSFLTDPAKSGFEKVDGAWKAPKDSRIARVAESLEAKQKGRDEQKSAYAEDRAKDAEKQTALEGNWSRLSDSDQAGIVNGVQSQSKELDPNGPIFHAICLVWARDFISAIAEKSRWNSLSEDDRVNFTHEARDKFPLWAATEDGLRSACLTVMDRRLRQRAKRS
jgi:hypothetical protein